MGVVAKPITEAEFTAQVLQLAKLRGWRSAHFRPAKTRHGWRTPVQGDGAGWPDLVLARGKRMIFAELKRSEKEKPRPDQEIWLAALRQIPGIGVYLWSPADWREIEEVLA